MHVPGGFPGTLPLLYIRQPGASVHLQQHPSGSLDMWGALCLAMARPLPTAGWSLQANERSTHHRLTYWHQGLRVMDNRSPENPKRGQPCQPEDLSEGWFVCY